MNLKQQLAALIAAAQQIVKGAETAGRDLTPEELADVKAKTAEARGLKERIERQAEGDALAAQLGGMAPGERHGGGTDTSGKGHLSLRGLTDDIVAGMKGVSGRMSPGVKALVPAGETVVPIPIVNSGDPLASTTGQEQAPRLIDVLPVRVREAAVYQFLRQAVIADAGGASVVAPGAVKPTRKLGLETVDARLRVIAVLSEPMDKFLLEDASNLRTWVSAELADAIEEALENEVLTGDGTGEHFTGLANTSGIQTQAYSTDRITTIAAGLAKLTTVGIRPDFIALAPADVLALQTTRNASGAFDLGGAIDAAASTAWGTTYVAVPGLTAGDGYVVGDGTVELSTDNRGVRVEWGTPGDTWTRNQVQARVEGRFNLDVLKPHGVVRMALTGA